MDEIQAQLRAQEEENRRLAAERKRKLDEMQHKVRWGAAAQQAVVTVITLSFKLTALL